MNARARGLAMALATAVVAAAQRSALDQLPPDAEAMKYHAVAFGPEFEPVALPCDGPIRGLAKLGDTLWVRSGDALVAIDWRNKTEVRRLAAPAGTVGLAADARWLYLLRDAAVVAFDPATATEVRTLAVPSASGASALAVHAGKLHVVAARRLVVVDLATGAEQPGAACEGGLLQWVASDGTRLYGGDAVDCMDVSAGAAVRRWPALLSNACAAWVDDRLLLAAEHVPQPGQTIRMVGTLPAAAVGKRPAIRVQVTGTGEQLRMATGGRVYERLDDLQRELSLLATDPKQRDQGPDGKSRPPRVEILAGPGTLVRELKAVWQAVVTSGLPDASCPAQAAWLRERAAAQPQERR